MKKQPTRSDSGSFTVKKSSFYYCLRFRQNGRTAVEMVQFIDDILRSEYPERAIIKYLGFTAEVTRHSPGKGADYWVKQTPPWVGGYTRFWTNMISPCGCFSPDAYPA